MANRVLNSFEELCITWEWQPVIPHENAQLEGEHIYI